MKEAVLSFRTIARFGTTFIGGVLIALIGAFFVLRLSSDSPTDTRIRRGDAGTVHELIDIETAEARERPFSALRKNISRVLNAYAEDVPAVSVYYEDLASGKWIAINPDASYRAVSMLKVPALIFAHRIGEKHPDVWTTPIRYLEERSGSVRNNGNDPERTILFGQSYSLEDILFRMIAYSDNTSKDAVLAYLSQRYEQELLETLGDIAAIIEHPISDSSLTEQLSVRPYASLFRMLYNASYLSEHSSEQALTLLQQSEFSHGIRGAIPEHIPVASKFGLYQSRMLGPDDLNQLHDCGIVYDPNTPYILCIFTKTHRHAVSGQLIQDTARLVQKFVSAQYAQ